MTEPDRSRLERFLEALGLLADPAASRRLARVDDELAEAEGAERRHRPDQARQATDAPGGPQRPGAPQVALGPTPAARRAGRPLAPPIPAIVARPATA